MGKGHTAGTESDKSQLCHLLARVEDRSGPQCPHLSNGRNDTFLALALQDQTGGHLQKAR